MKVSEMMTRDVRVASPDQTIHDAAAVMAEQDIGSLPVGDNDRLVGMITDRDMVVRAIAKGRGADARVREVMTEDIEYCYDDEDADRITSDMAPAPAATAGDQPRQAAGRHRVAGERDTDRRRQGRRNGAAGRGAAALTATRQSS